MNHLKSYKLFESKEKVYDIWDAINYLSQKDIEQHYKEHYDLSYEQLCEQDPNFVWNRDYIDEEKWLNDFINDKIDKIIYSGVDFNKYDKNEYKYFFEEQYKELVNDNTTLNEYIEIIKKEKLEREFLKYVFENKFWNKEPKEIAKIYDSNYLDNTFDLTYLYVNDNQVIDDYIEQIEFSFKWDYVAVDIPYYPHLQLKILEYNPKNALILFDVIEFEGKIGIAKNYNFQKYYIEYYDGEIPKALKNLYDRFGLNEKIKQEFKDYLYLIDADKYNL